MRLHLIGAVICLSLAYCCANPITIINAGHQGPPTELRAARNLKEVEIENKGIKEEETQGVFKKDDISEVKKVAESESESAKKPNESEKSEVSDKKEEGTETKLAEKKEEAKTVKKAVLPKKSHHKAKVTGRQSSDDDDDDDDEEDDDILGLGGDEEEDDDEEDDDDEGDNNDVANESGNVRDEEDDEDEEEEEGDYDDFERFFQDILGGGDDDDDDDSDDDVSPSTGDNEVVANSAVPARPQVAEPAVSVNSNVAEETAPTEQLNAAGEIDASGTDLPIGESLIETDPIDDEPVPVVQNSVQEPEVVDPVPADEPVNNETDNDDDADDDDDEDSDEADDDDDDEDDDDDDDEDDSDDLADFDARKARSAKPALPKMPPVYVSKYNRFADAVINRINRILGKQYDPVRVKLLSNLRNDLKKNTPIKTKKNQKKGAHSRENVQKSEQLNKMGELELARSKYDTVGNDASRPRITESESREPAFVLISRVGSTSESTSSAPKLELRTTPAAKSRTTTKNKNKKHNKTKTSTKASNKNQVKQTTASKNNKDKARATLFGLSSIKRDGDVVVNMMSDHTIVKTNFILGPLTLRVERELARSGKRVLRSATATTAEMFGKMTLKIVHGGAATLTSLKVLQPKQVRIDSSDGHDKTTQFMWKKSPEIAGMVSQKLSAATKSMLQPPPQPRP